MPDLPHTGRTGRTACTEPATPAPAGFTLLELLLAVAVLALLAALSYPSYTAHVAKGRRADARQALQTLAIQLEQRYTRLGSYAGATLGADGLPGELSAGGFYSLAIVSASADGFSIRATPRGAQAGDACGSYLYNQLGEQAQDSDASLSAARCW